MSLCQGLLYKQRNVVGIMNVSFNETDEILIMDSAYITGMGGGRGGERIWNSVGQHSK